MIQPERKMSIDAVQRLRGNYDAVCRSLPWLDMSVWPEDPPAFPEYARNFSIPFIESVSLNRTMKGFLANLKAEKNIRLLRYAPSAGSIEELTDLFPEMAEQKIPLVVLHTDVNLKKLEILAENYPSMIFIIESGPRKILYLIRELEQLLVQHQNIFLCTYNFCNWLGIESFCRKGLSGQLLFGTHQPRYNIHAAMGPVAMGRLTWGEKCAIAGNNLRRLLEIPAEAPTPINFETPEPFMVDAHGHNGPAEKFPVADLEFGPEGWKKFMDSCGIERLFVCSSQALADPANNPEELTRPLRERMPGRVFYFAVFFPRRNKEYVNRLSDLLRNPACIGIKIHPSLHGVAADDPAYDQAYALAERCGLPILTHSWDVSDTNPVQHLSHPDRFRSHLETHPDVTLVLGHAGGRPGALDSVVSLCRDFSKVRVDLSGDYYDNGLLEKLTDSIGLGKIIFGSDVNWIDPRANLAPVLAAKISDEDILRIIRTNALNTYKNP